MGFKKRKSVNLKNEKNKNAKSIKVPQSNSNFHIEFKNKVQSEAWAAFQKFDVLFLLGSAGTGKTFLASAFAIEQILNNKRNKIILTRPIVEAGESLGFLPGEFSEKVHPYMIPLYDCMDQMVGSHGPWREKIDQAVEVAPIAFMRGRSFLNSICIFDEAQNASLLQLKLFLTRFGENSKIIITGDPTQSDIGNKVALVEVVQKLRGLDGVGFIEFNNDCIVRHPLVGKIIDRLG